MSDEKECDHDCIACWKRAAAKGMRAGIAAIRKEVDTEVMKGLRKYMDEMVKGEEGE